MELYQLAYFIAVAEHRNFTRAAERLHLAQPALSQQMKNLESELGAPLFVRSRKATVLTQAGEVLLAKARNLLADATAAKQAVADVANLKRGKLVLAAIPSISGRWLPPALRRFRQAYPQIELILKEGSSDEVSTMIDTAQAEIGFLQFPTDNKRFAAGLILSEAFVVLLPRSHDLARSRAISLTQLADEPFVLYKGKAKEVVLNTCRDLGFEPTVACESGELETVRSLVAAHLGVAVLPELAVQSVGKTLVVQSLKKPRLARKLGWIHRRDAAPSSAAQAFLDTIAS